MPPETEVEVKFRLTNPDVADGLRRWPNLAYRYPLTPVQEVTDVDTYFDTPDYRLLRRGRTLRVRVHNGETFVTTKTIDQRTPKGLHARREVELPAPHLNADAALLRVDLLPLEVLDALEEADPHGLRLTPIARLVQTRSKRDLLQPGSLETSDENRLAEVSVDEVSLEKLGRREKGKKQKAAPPPWSAVAHFAELEVELLGDTEKADLKEVATRLRELPGLTPNAQNKLQQAVVLLAESPALAPEAVGKHHVADFCRGIWAQQLAQMLINEAGVRDSDDVEYVHDMRVATRRARAAGRLYASFFKPGCRRVRTVMLALRQTGRLLGAVRDLDVALVRLNEYARTLPEGQEGSLQQLAGYWQAQRSVAHATLLQWLDGKHYRNFVTGLSRFAAKPGAGSASFRTRPGVAPIPYQVRHALPSMIMNRYESIRAFEVFFESGDPVPVETLHALRIECKYLRYHLEFSAALLGAEGEELISALKALQEHLGDLNDAAVSATMLLEARAALQDASACDEDGSSETDNDENQPAGSEQRDEPWASDAPLDRYLQRQYAAVQDLAARLPADLEQFLSLQTRRKLALALANL